MIAILVLLFSSGLALASSAAGEPGPGPAAISDEEMAIVADPNNGATHGVILLEEWLQDDNAKIGRTRFHMRAKILSNEGRDLANVEIPLRHKEAELKEWWGRVLTPDGSKTEIPREQLTEKSVIKSARREVRTLNVALPGVEPGTVIDFGYEVRDPVISWATLVPLQRAWPMRRLRYRWIPVTGENPAATLRRESTLNATVTKESPGGAFVVNGEQLPPVVEEPDMPPDNEVRSAANLYYVRVIATDAANFWTTVGRAIEKITGKFNKADQPLKTAIASMKIPPEADMQARLKSAYDWLTVNVKDVTRRTSEEIEIEEEKASVRLGTAGTILAAKEGNSWQVGLLLVGLARALGAEAGIVLATDRTEQDWHPSLLSWDQFDEIFVAVRAPGEPDDKATILDPCSGLPYGEIPWWAAGGKAMLHTATGYREIALKVSDGASNVSRTSANIHWDEEGAAKASWSRAGSGQAGYLDRLTLRVMAPEKRSKRLDELCGVGDTMEVTSASSANLDALTAGFQLGCEEEMSAGGGAPAAQETRVGFEGPWIETTPDFPDPNRFHAVVFSFARTDSLTMEVSAPPGFVASTPPAAVEIKGPFGIYNLAVTATPAGYRIQRDLMLPNWRYEARSYPGLRSFFQRVHRADRTSLVFKREGTVTR